MCLPVCVAQDMFRTATLTMVLAVTEIITQSVLGLYGITRLASWAGMFGAEEGVWSNLSNAMRLIGVDIVALFASLCIMASFSKVRMPHGWKGQHVRSVGGAEFCMLDSIILLRALGGKSAVGRKKQAARPIIYG